MASVLETFLIIFDADASNVKKGADAAKKTTDKLNASLKTTDLISNKLGASFLNFARQAGGALLAIVSAGAVIAGVKAAATYADKLDELSQGLDVNIEELGAWGDAVKLAGGTAESFQETVKGMTGALSQIAVKGKSRVSAFFDELGIKAVDARGKARSFFDILPELADAFQNLSKMESFGIGQKLGLDQGTIMLLQKGRGAVEDLIKRQRELGVVTKEQGEIAAKFNDQLDDTAHAFRSLFVTIGGWVLPAFTSVLKAFERVALFFRKHSDLIIGGLVGIGAALTYFVLPALIKVAVAAAPWIAIGLAIAAVAAGVALLYDDVVNFYKGNDSLLGQLIEKWAVLGDILKAIEHDIPIIGGIFKDFFNGVIEAVGGLITLVKELLIFFFVDIPNAINTAMGKLKEFFSFGGKKIESAVTTGQGILSTAANNKISGVSSNSIISANRSINKNTTVQTGDITIETQATDSAGIAAALGASLQTQMRQANNNYDDGLLA